MLINDKVDKVRRLPGVVPHTTTLPDGRLVIIDTMSDSQLSETFGLIQAAAQSGNGFGVDEYSSEKEFREDIDGSFNFAIMSKDTGEMVAAFMLAISKYYRGCNSVADPFIIVKKSERGKRIGEFCLQMCVDFAQDLNFVGMYVDTFSNNRAMIKIIENVGGFTQVGCLPMGGKMKDGSIVSSIIFYKDFNP
ncbi:uncharacterized protein LOC124286317 [Haliotis rubra]|uniref:uncharacterized protein LOC124286316 n=1 Tax=Haliotis rubra TaxID=36100 RepID=UPI001EE58DFF|nr:uncharacterized protein LOC124286316 [Haliotis rubra]XP_046578635.1 uncharacterized protein LOC124286317 [Haliotis rubra]